MVEGRPVDRDDFVMKNTNSHRGLVANTIGKSLLLPKDMVSWQENNFERLIENLKRHSMLVSLSDKNFCLSTFSLRVIY
jgi:hypothetical protein